MVENLNSVYLIFKMRIRHLEEISSIDKVVPVDVLLVFGRYYYTAIYPGAFYRSHKFPC